MSIEWPHIFTECPHVPTDIPQSPVFPLKIIKSSREIVPGSGSPPGCYGFNASPAFARGDPQRALGLSTGPMDSIVQNQHAGYHGVPNKAVPNGGGIIAIIAIIAIVSFVWIM